MMVHPVLLRLFMITILASACVARNILLNGEGLYAVQSLKAGPYSLTMQDDCNLVLYQSKTPVWATNTAVKGRKGCRAIMQSDGNFVVYDSKGGVVWASNSNVGKGNYVLVLQKDRNVVIYGSNVWSTGTKKRSGVVVTGMINATVDGGLRRKNATAAISELSAVS